MNVKGNATLEDAEEYLKQVFSGPYKLTILVVLPVLGAFGFLSKNVTYGILSIVGGFLVAAVVNSVWTGFTYYRQGIVPIKVRDTQLVNDFDGINVIITLDRRSWMEIGQVLLLKVYFGAVPSNLGLIEVNRRTKENYPCAILIHAFTDDAQELLLDHSRLPSLGATPIIENWR